MKIKANKLYKWDINFKAHVFEEGKEYEVAEKQALDMIKYNYAEDADKPKKETLVSENKAIESVSETKKSKPKPKSKSSKK